MSFASKRIVITVILIIYFFSIFPMPNIGSNIDADYVQNVKS